MPENARPLFEALHILYDEFEGAIASKDAEALLNLAERRVPLLDALCTPDATARLSADDRARLLERERALQESVRGFESSLVDDLQFARANARASRAYAKAQRRS